MVENEKSPLAGESQEPDEDLAVIEKNLSQLKRGDSPILSIGKADLSLMKQMLSHPENEDAFTKIVLLCDFLDEDEANRELDAFWEADRLGMTTNYNIDHALSRAAINRKGAHNSSRVGALLDALSHQKITSNMPKGKDGSRSPNSPIA